MNLQLVCRNFLSLSKNENMFEKNKWTNKKLGKQKQNEQKEKRKKFLIADGRTPRPKRVSSTRYCVAPRHLMLQKAQHCAPKKERICPLQLLEGVYGNSVRAEKSLRTLPEKKVLKFSRNALQKSTPLFLSRRGSKFTLRICLGSVASRKTRISIRHASINVRVKA